MPWEVLINGGILQTRLALVHDSRLMEIHHLPLGAVHGFGEYAVPAGTKQNALEGQIYLGRVVNVAKPLSAAFVDIGEVVNGFLPLNTLPRRKNASLVEGEAILVQVVKAAYQDKGPRLSARIPSTLTPSGAKPPYLLYQGEGALCRALMKLCDGVDVQNICVDHAAAFGLLSRRCNKGYSGRLERAAPGDLFSRSGIEDQIEDARLALCALPSGGSLLFETTSALTAIDVNGGAMRSDDLRLKVNLEAAAAIAPELRRRGIGGQIVVDFLALKKPAQWRQIIQSLKTGLVRDPAATSVEQISKGGLLAITRERRFEPLVPARPNFGSSSGAIPHIAHEILHDLQRLSHQRTNSRPCVEADAQVINWLDKQPGLSCFLERDLGLPTTWKPRDTIHAHSYKINENS